MTNISSLHFLKIAQLEHKHLIFLIIFSSQVETFKEIFLLVLSLNKWKDIYADLESKISGIVS